MSYNKLDEMTMSAWKDGKWKKLKRPLSSKPLLEKTYAIYFMLAVSSSSATRSPLQDKVEPWNLEPATSRVSTGCSPAVPQRSIDRSSLRSNYSWNNIGNLYHRSRYNWYRQTKYLFMFESKQAGVQQAQNVASVSLLHLCGRCLLVTFLDSLLNV